MEIKKRHATWLELAAARLSLLGQGRIRLHALTGGGCHSCLGITLNGRWLCANDGRLTIFDCREAARRFLELLRIDKVEDGDTAALPSGSDVQCMRLGTRGLRVCNGRGTPARTTFDAPRCMVPQAC
ncbi:hypothetical protein [Zoogloea sp.]|uniref:hypothetical protein n=1 Tax=Zoogloea sp. TaxID=49181 RepID=UPI0035AEC6E6